MLWELDSTFPEPCREAEIWAVDLVLAESGALDPVLEDLETVSFDV